MVTSITWTPEKPLTYEEITFKVTIRNNGTAASPVCQLSFQLANDVMTTTIPAIQPGAQLIFTRKDNFTASFNFLIKAVIDPDNKLPELNENNNTLTTNLYVPHGVDLFAKEITWTPENPKTTDEVNLRVVVQNIGRGNSPETTAEFYIGNTPYQINIPQLAPSGEYVYREKHVFTLSSFYTLKFRVDPRNLVIEANEDNNTLDTRILLMEGSKPDLTVTSINLNPQTPTFGQPAQITITIKNLGPGDALPSVGRLQVGKAKKEFSVPALKAGNVHTINETTAFVVPNQPLYLLTFIVDSKKEIEEINENNNVKQISVSVKQN